MMIRLTVLAELTDSVAAELIEEIKTKGQMEMARLVRGDLPDGPDIKLRRLTLEQLPKVSGDTKTIFDMTAVQTCFTL